jgi:hypothetical protein
VLTKAPSDLRIVASMQLRTQFAKARAASSKRSRATLEAQAGSDKDVMQATP